MGETIPRVGLHRPGRSIARAAKWILAASRLILVFTVFAIAAMLVSAAIGYSLAHQNDARLVSEQHSALRNAAAEFRSPINTSGDIDSGLVRVAEHVKNLKFERDPDSGEREIRPVMDATGRIAGFFTWDKTKPMMRVMGRLASFFAAIAVVLFGFAALSLWQLKRARRELGEREVQAARAADEDKLTGLSNHGKTLELLDLALAERRDEDWTTFALIGLDGLEDVTAHHGVMGSDELIVAVARRLKQVLPVHAMCGHNLKRSEVHSSRTSAGDQRKRARGVLPADRVIARRTDGWGRGPAALDARHARCD
ncbi:MAG: hypothetical protein WBX35_24550 [Pseudolabrys sp.]